MIEVYQKDEVYFKLNIDYSIASELRDHLSCLIENHFFHPKVRAGIWDGRISFFSPVACLLPIGLFKYFFEFCKKNDYKYITKFDKNILFEKIELSEIYHYSNEILMGTEWKIRDYQANAVHNIIQRKRGIVLSSTGSGKSLMIYHALRYILNKQPDKKILLIVPSIGLVTQIYNDFVDYGWDEIEDNVCTLYTGQELDLEKRVLISTYQSLAKKPSSFFVDFGALFVDETHTAKSFSILNISKKCINAAYRIGFTGTLQKNLQDRYNIFGSLGTIIFKQGTNDLIKRGLLSDIEINNILLQYPKEIIRINKRRPYHEEVSTVEEYTNRNKVFDYVFKNIKNGENSLVLCRHISHLENIENYLVDKLPDKYSIYKIHGNINAKERENIRQLMDIEKNIILIGTYATMSTGINIKNLHNIVFASSYKSKIKILQSIGRGLRTCKNKTKMILWDIVDDLRWDKNVKRNKGDNHLFKHFRERIMYYKEQKFKYKTVFLKI